MSRLGRPSDLLAELPPLAVAATRRLKLTECGIGDRGPTLLSSLRLTAMPNRKHGSLGTPSLARLVDHRRLTGISGPVAVVRLRPGPALTMSTKCRPMSRLRSARESRAIDGGGTRAGRARCRESADKRKGGPTLWCAGRERHCGRRRGARAFLVTNGRAGDRCTPSRRRQCWRQRGGPDLRGNEEHSRGRSQARPDEPRATTR